MFRLFGLFFWSLKIPGLSRFRSETDLAHSIFLIYRFLSNIMQRVWYEHKVRTPEKANHVIKKNLYELDVNHCDQNFREFVL